MKTAIAELVGIAPISFSRNPNEPKFEGEEPDAFDKRTWRDKAYAHPDGRVYIPGVVLAKAIKSTAKAMGEKVPGAGSKRWGGVFLSGIMCPDPIDILVPAPSKIVTTDTQPSTDRRVPVMKDEIAFVDVYCDAQGRPGTGKVWRRFPIVQPPWYGIATLIVTNDKISEAVLRKHLDMCGVINGLGRYRPQNGGDFGRFTVAQLEWQDEAKLRSVAA
jgi:hypothetical protein